MSERAKERDGEEEYGYVRERMLKAKRKARRSEESVTAHMHA